MTPLAPHGPEAANPVAPPARRTRTRSVPPSRFLVASVVLHGTALAAAALVLHGREVRPATPVAFESRVDETPEIRRDEEPPLPPAELPERPTVEEPMEDLPPLDVRWTPEEEFEPAVVSLGDPLGRTPPPRGARPPGRGDAEFGPPAAPPAPAVSEAPAPEEPAPPRISLRTRARLISSPAPSYPECARAAGAEGIVRLRVEVLEDGTVGEVEVVSSSGSRALDEAAIEAVRSWTFEPARADGVPLRVRVELKPIRFLLRG